MQLASWPHDDLDTGGCEMQLATSTPAVDCAAGAAEAPGDGACIHTSSKFIVRLERPRRQATAS
jgi:hypothetical protein